MDNTRTSGSSRDGTRPQGGGTGVSQTAAKAVAKEGDVKQDLGASVSNTYVADTMTVTNNYNF